MKIELMGRGYAWLDTGTHESSFIQTIEKLLVQKKWDISQKKNLHFLFQYLIKRANQPRRVIYKM